MPFEALSDSLSAKGMLTHRRAFVLLAQATGWDAQAKAGCYHFDQAPSAYRLLRRLRAGEQTAVRVTIPPGSHPAAVARTAARHMLFKKEDFRAALADEALAASLETDTLRLFGHMLPDTYHFFCTASAEAVVARIKREMDAFLDTLRTSHGLSRDDVLTLAGIVEWETNVIEEKADVAGVYLNRLQRGWPLQADPTIQFALLELEGRKRRLRYKDYRLQHPYNTYLYRGLPPGPITNPNRTSLLAATRPERHDYMFFVASPEGGHAFNVTLKGHNRDAARLRKHLRQQRAKTAN